MNTPSNLFRQRLSVAAIVVSALACVLFLGRTQIYAADNEFVGVLALVVEDEIAHQIGLSQSVRTQLLDLVDEREAEALDIALKLRDATAAERVQTLAPFRKTSEQMGLKLLTQEQRQALQGIRIAKTGMSSLEEPEVAKRMKLSAEQRKQVQQLLDARSKALSKAAGLQAKRIRAGYERQLKAVLNPEQLVAWSGLSNPKLGKPTKAKQDGFAKPGQRLAAGRKAFSAQGDTANGENALGKLRFSFRYTPWGDVIEWFANESSLSLLMDAPPQGTFNYADPREYTPAQAIDLLNSVLLTKGYTLVRRDQMLMVINLEDGIPPNLITEVAVEDLDKMGEYELVKTLFTLRGVRAEDASEEISRLVGPQGKVNVLASSNQLQITETAGRLRTFRKILEAGERKGDAALGSAKLIPLKHIRANDVLTAWRKLMGLSEEENVSADGSTRLAKGKTSRQLLVSGEEYRVKEVEELVAILDTPPGGGSPLNTPQLDVYPVTDADPESVLAVIQELFVDSEEIRLTIDPSTGNLVALATPEEHAMIKATVTQLQGDKRQVEVIRLRTVDPQLAMLSIEKLFGAAEATEEGAKPNPNTPRVDADPISRSLLIRASESQIADIRTLLVKMGEQDPSGDSDDRSLASGRGNLRLIPIDAATARRALEQMNNIWPTVRKNEIRTVRPSRTIRGLDSSRDGEPQREGKAPKPKEEEPLTPSQQDDVELRSVVIEIPSKYVQVEVRNAAASPAVDEQIAESDADEAIDPAPETSEDTLPAVVVTIGEQGLLIASEDLEALDEFEEIFMTLADRLFTGSREMAIFYLKYAKAEVASEMLKQFITGGSGGSSDGGTTLLGSLAGAALGNSGIGSMLGLGGGSGGGSSARISSGTTVISDPRLNAVIVQATPKELDFIEQLLELLDKSSSPERIETVPAPRAIPVLNTDATSVADIVRSVYATRLAGGASMGNRQPSPEEFIRAMSGQKNTSRTIKDSIRDQVQLNVSVDTRRNALLVVAPDSLFEEIKALVADLDVAAPELAETIKYGQVKGSSPEMIRAAIATMMSEDQQSNRKDTSAKSKSGSSQPSGKRAPGFEEMRRRMDFFKSMQNRAAKDRAAAKKAAAKRSK